MTDSISLFKDIYTGVSYGSGNSSSPSYLTVFNGSLYFRADNGINGAELWKTDGTDQGTVLVKDIYTGSGSSAPSNLTVFNGSLYFSARDGNGTELWKTDGTAQGTVLVKDIYTGASFGFANNSDPSYLTVFNGSLYFSARDGNGIELWKTDGTAQGTVLVQNIYTGTNNSSDPFYLTVFNGSLYFSAYNENGRELFVLTATNNAPTVATPIADRTVATNTAFSFTFNANTFTDLDGDTLTYTTNTLPAGLTFDAATRTFSGTLTNAGNNTIQVTANDGNGGTVIDSFDLTSATPTPGTVNNDTFNGTASIDVINGLGGNDIFIGTLGGDFVDGGTNTDRVDYKNSLTGITVNLATGINTGGDAEGDTLISIEEVFGSALADDLTGNSTDHTLYGGGGNDNIRGGSGKGYLRGNLGNDLIYGGNNDDRLLGDEGNDTVYGGAGNDILKGWTGDDNLFGDAGTDTIYGDNGNDTLTGANLTSGFGVGEIDRFFGGLNNDTFVLGDSSRAYYNDGNNTKNGVADYARIADFNSTQDTVRLFSGATYYLGAALAIAGTGTGLFIDNDGTAGLSAKDEFIAVFENQTLTYGQVSGATTGFTFV
ncbi:putative Ig domain-containing protein [Dolichospermum sp. ST_sed1]|nr:putative Ig domain-containing protein [Dolichospermum sp. ST_sed1]